MKTKTILPALAMTAVAGAAVFLVTLTPSCDPQNEAAERGRLSQKRTFAAAVRTAGTLETALEQPPEKIHAELAGQRADVERRAQARMAQRRFLKRSPPRFDVPGTETYDRVQLK